MKKTILIALGVVSLSAFASAQVEILANATLVSSQSLDQYHQNRVVTPGALYSNDTNFTGFYASPGGATSLTVGTVALMDDVQMISGAVIGKFYFTVVNPNATSMYSTRHR